MSMDPAPAVPPAAEPAAPAVVPPPEQAFTRHSRLGVASFVIALVALVVNVLALTIGFFFMGEWIFFLWAFVGAIPTGLAVLVGLVLGIVSIPVGRRAKKRIVFGVIGLVTNAVLFAPFAAFIVQQIVWSIDPSSGPGY